MKTKLEFTQLIWTSLIIVFSTMFLINGIINKTKCEDPCRLAIYVPPIPNSKISPEGECFCDNQSVGVIQDCPEFENGYDCNITRCVGDGATVKSIPVSQ